MQTFAIILCGFIIILLMIIGFMMDEIDKWKRVAFNYKKSIEQIYGTCGLSLKDWRNTGCSTKLKKRLIE